jgi:hypothetical protein
MFTIMGATLIKDVVFVIPMRPTLKLGKEQL